MKRQGNKPEKSYIELASGAPVWVHHRQNATWEPAIVVNQCAPNPYWIKQENGTEQPKVYRYTRAMLKIRSTPPAVEQTGHMKDYPTEIRKSESRTPAVPNTVRNSVHKNSLDNISPDPVQSTLPRLDLLQAPFDSNQKTRMKLQDHCVQMELHHWRYLRKMGEIHPTLQDLISQQERTLGSQPVHLVIFTCKDTFASGSVDYQLKMLNIELYITFHIKARLVQNPLQYSIIPIIGIDYCQHFMSFRTIAPLNT